MLLFNQNNNFEQKQFWTVGVASIRFYLSLWRSMFCKIKTGFYSLVCFPCEYLRTQKLENVVFLYKTAHLSRHSFEKWVWSLWNCAYYDRDRCYLGQKMASSDLFSLIANYLLWHTEFESFESFESFNLNIKL